MYKKQKSGCMPIIILGVIIFVLYVIFSGSANGAEPEQMPEKSRLVLADDGVLWFEQGKNKRNVFDAMYKEVSKTDTFAVVFWTNEANKVQMVANAHKLADYFRPSPHIPDDMLIIGCMDEAGVGFMFWLDELAYGDDGFAPNAIMSPRMAWKAKDDIILSFQAMTVVLNEKEFSRYKPKR